MSSLPKAKPDKTAKTPPAKPGRVAIGSWKILEAPIHPEEAPEEIALALDIEGISTGYLRADPLAGYADAEVKGEIKDSPPLSHVVPDHLKELFDFIRSDPAILEAHTKLAKKQGATFSFTAASGAEASKAPPQWAERTSGRKVSPIAWIRTHYGTSMPDGTWSPAGLRREHLLSIDPPLYFALAQWVKRHPEDDFDPSAGRKRKPYDDPAEAVERLRAQKRAYNQKRPY